jgi:hypothetical protein
MLQQAGQNTRERDPHERAHSLDCVDSIRFLVLRYGKVMECVLSNA